MNKQKRYQVWICMDTVNVLTVKKENESSSGFFLFIAHMHLVYKHSSVAVKRSEQQ